MYRGSSCDFDAEELEISSLPTINVVVEMLRHCGRDMSSSLAAFYFVFVIVSSLFSREENPLWHF